MPRRTPIALGEDDRRFLGEVRSRHPSRRSACGALLAEILAAEDVHDRIRAAIVFGLLGCRRGVRRLEGLIGGIETRIELASEPTERSALDLRLLNQLLFAVGRMDTARSHSLLARVVGRSRLPAVRALAIEGTAFEDESFDFDLVEPYLSMQAHPNEIVSALYALEFQNYASRLPADARERISPLLRHESPRVRAQAVRTLSFHTANRDLVELLSGDLDALVAESVAEALKTTGMFADSPVTIVEEATPEVIPMALSKSYYTVDGEILGERTVSGRVNYGVDALGSVTSTLVGDAVQNRYAYKPYGDQLSRSGAGSDPSFRWVGSLGYRQTGRAYSESYVRARHYAQGLGRWTTVDPLWPEEGAYGYVAARPITVGDPSGTDISIIILPFLCVNRGTHRLYTCADFHGKAASICCVPTGTMITYLCGTTDCTKSCTEAHEAVHRKQGASCCKLAAKCYHNAKTASDRDACWNAFEGWFGIENQYALECPAYKVSAKCFKGLWDTCDKTHPYAAPCCIEWKDNWETDQQRVHDYCTGTKVSDCPFDASGNIKGGRGGYVVA